MRHLADRQLKFRRIGGRVLILIAELERLARMDHPQRRGIAQCVTFKSIPSEQQLPGFLY
jgi:hypothetical protein